MTFDEMWEKLRKSYPDVVASAEEYENKLNGFVDKNSAINALCFDCTEQDHCKDFCADARRILDLPVSLDVLPVVRCKDCKHWEPSEEGCYCNHLEIVVENPDFFCAAGKWEADNDD